MNDEYPVYIGGGFYELSDGSSVRGKQTAEDAQIKLDGGLPEPEPVPERPVLRCPREMCRSAKVRMISATGRKGLSGGILPGVASCYACGKRFQIPA